MKIVKSLSDWLIIILFTGVLLGSFLLWAIQPAAQFSDSEKRPLAVFPELTAGQNADDFFEKIDIYYQDHFGLREWLIYRYQREVSKRFGESGMPFAIEGKDGWLFYAMEGILEDLQGQLRFSQDELEHLCRGLQMKHDWFAKQNILYIPLVAPNKQSIYEHKLKDSYRALKGNGTRFDQVLATCSNDLLYDLRPDLITQGAHVRGYAKTDTHWNEKGALPAYYYLMNEVQKVFPDFLIRKQFTFAEKPSVTKGGDLAVLLGREDLLKEFWPKLQDYELRIKRGTVSPALQQYLSLPQLQPMLYRGNPSAKRLLVLHDSFFNTLKPYTSVNFSESLYVWQFFDEESVKLSGPANLLPILKTFRPDVVVEEIVERHLEMLLESVNHDWSTLEWGEAVDN